MNTRSTKTRRSTDIKAGLRSQRQINDKAEQAQISDTSESSALASVLGTSAFLNVPLVGNASPSEVVKGDDSRLHSHRGSAPATSSSTGSEGDIVKDSNYIYVCVATNTWKRAALSTW